MTVFETREKLMQLFNFLGKETEVIFTPGNTYDLNQIIRGFLRPGDHVIVSSMEHNAVMRPRKQMGVVSIDFIGNDNAETAYRLERDYGILTRSGLHCAPNAHRTLGTFPQGTVRFSFSYATTEEEIDYRIGAIRSVV